MEELMKNGGRARGGQRGPRKTTEERRQIGLKVQEGFKRGKSYLELEKELGENYRMLRSCFDQVDAEQFTEEENSKITRISTTLGVNGTTNVKPVDPKDHVDLSAIMSQVRLEGSALRPELKATQERSRRDKLIDAAIEFPDKVEWYYEMIKMLEGK